MSAPLRYHVVSGTFISAAAGALRYLRSTNTSRPSRTRCIYLLSKSSASLAMRIQVSSNPATFCLFSSWYTSVESIYA